MNSVFGIWYLVCNKNRTNPCNPWSKTSIDELSRDNRINCQAIDALIPFDIPILFIFWTIWILLFLVVSYIFLFDLFQKVFFCLRFLCVSIDLSCFMCCIRLLLRCRWCYIMSRFGNMRFCNRMRSVCHSTYSMSIFTQMNSCYWNYLLHFSVSKFVSLIFVSRFYSISSSRFIVWNLLWKVIKISRIA